ncbi:MAG TPA: YihY/virulence factor BrkB family protein [Solirubrobacteraceae bacterium]|nr:YihY/virulence factor BrkB family protein [Solirubrobacteraceae bacterium]
MTRAPHRVRRAVGHFFSVVFEANVTGLSSMLAYAMLLTVIPVALLGLFVAGQVLKSGQIEHSILRDLSEIFPGATKSTLSTLLTQIRVSTTKTGVLALVASVWFGASFWGAMDTAFARIYGVPARSWWAQKRFGLAMLLVLLVFMLSMVAAPTVVSLLQAGARGLPFDLARVGSVVYRISLGFALVLLFASLCVIYKAVPNRPVPWRAIWPGAAAATPMIALVAFVFPLYLDQISTIAQFGTTIVFVLIVLAWFYALAIIILGGGVVNSMRLARSVEPVVAPVPEAEARATPVEL